MSPPWVGLDRILPPRPGLTRAEYRTGAEISIFSSPPSSDRIMICSVYYSKPPPPPLMSLIWLTSLWTLSIPILMLICCLVNIIYSFFYPSYLASLPVLGPFRKIAILILEAFRIWLVSLLIRQCTFLLSIIKFRSASDTSMLECPEIAEDFTRYFSCSAATIFQLC